MKSMTKIFPLVVFCIFLLSACSPRLSPFTQKLYKENNWNPDQLKRIQFYLSDGVTLRRQRTDADSRISGGKIRMEQGREIEEIIIPKGTPGVLSYIPKENRFAISFEEGKSNRTLIFGPDSRGNNRYVLKVVKWKDTKGIIRYDDKNYYIYKSDALALLMVDLKKIRKTQVKKRVAKGNEI
ncbi:MAG: hypothetical protein ACI85O_001142 [Saprospiraceae bacterium]|jgi:hypothetical protein